MQRLQQGAVGFWMELVFSIAAAYSRFAFTFELILPTFFPPNICRHLNFAFPVVAEINKRYWSGFPPDSTRVSADLPFLCRCRISQPSMSGGFQSRLLSERLFALVLHCCAKRKTFALKCAVLFIWAEGSVWTRWSKLLTRRRSVASLFIVTWSGKALLQTAGAVQTASPSPWGGHYDRDEQLKAL